ncbi:hypothetical protein EDB86DRAFT_2829145 [Lactarius hatsudake]|nr:hypothetical protein EDB86DRAFT_2829145 [Lactarius hatsudake]
MDIQVGWDLAQLIGSGTLAGTPSGDYYLPPGCYVPSGRIDPTWGTTHKGEGSDETVEGRDDERRSRGEAAGSTVEGRISEVTPRFRSTKAYGTTPGKREGITQDIKATVLRRVADSTLYYSRGAFKLSLKCRILPMAIRRMARVRDKGRVSGTRVTDNKDKGLEAPHMQATCQGHVAANPSGPIPKAPGSGSRAGRGNDRSPRVSNTRSLPAAPLQRRFLRRRKAKPLVASPTKGP